MDLFSQMSAAAAASDEQILARSRQQIVSILQRFKFVRQCIKCSAKNLLNVDEIFLKAQQAVLYPITPLYDLNQGKIAHNCHRAFSRIFRMYDKDNDDLLSNAEINAFQNDAFRVPLVERDLAGWKKVVSKNNPSEESVIRNGKFTVAGFLIPLKVYQKWLHFIKYETIIFNIIGVGPFLTGIFLLINFFVSTNTFTHQYRIEKVYIDGEDSYQYIGVVLEGNVFSGEPKIVELTDEEMLTIYKKKSLMLTVSEGVFGFEVIKEKKLLD